MPYRTPSPRAAALGLLLLAVATTPSAWAQGDARLATIVQSYVDRGLFSGAVLVARGDQVLLDRGFGLASQEWKLPNAPDVKYLLASISKQFTAAAVLRLVDQGRLGLDDRLSQHLSGLPTAWSAITVRQLLAHTSGIPNHTEAGGLEQIHFRSMSPQQLYATFRDAKLDFEPGRGWAYSNSGYVMLGILIEKLAGKSYGDFVQAELLAPLGMGDSGLAHSEVITPRLASGYVRQGPSLRPATFLNMSVPYSAGALYGTTGDLLKWQRGLYGGKVLSAESLKAMTTPVARGYALGLNVSPPGQRVSYGHSGGIYGFSTYLQYEPAQQLTIAVLGNLEGDGAPQIAAKLSAAANGVAVVLPEERKPIQLPAAAMAAVVGSYGRKSGETLWVMQQGDQLWARLANQGFARLIAESPSAFYAPDVDGDLRFVLDATGRATAAQLPDLPDSPVWPRVNVPLPTFETQPVYLRGSMNRWSSEQKLSPGAAGLLRTAVDLPAGKHEFKVASEDWSSIDFGGAPGTPPLAGQGELVLSSPGRNIGLHLERASRCEFAVDGRNLIAPRLSVICLAK